MCSMEVLLIVGALPTFFFLSDTGFGLGLMREAQQAPIA